MKIYTIQPLSINEEGEYEVTVRVKNQYTTAQVVVMELDDSNTKSWFQTKVGRLDRDFSLGLNEEREVTLTIEVTETTLKNLNSDVFISNLTIWARSETVSDAANGRLEVTLIKQDSDSADAADDAGSGFPIEEIALWGVFLLILVGGVIVLLTVMRSEEDDDDEYKNWGEDGYEDSLSANYGAVASAPTVPVAGAPSPEPIPAGAPPQRQPRLLHLPRHLSMMACLRYLRVVFQTVGPRNSGCITGSNGLSRTARLERETPTMSQA